MAALPTTPAPDPRWTSPVAATVKLVTGSEPHRRAEALRNAAARTATAIREGFLIVAAVAALVYGTFIIPVVGFVLGWFVLAAGLLLIDWCRRAGAADRGSP